MDTYTERAELVALLTRIFPSWVLTDPAEPDRPVVYVQLPTGQCSWHISPGNWAEIFAHLGLPCEGPPWDGHTMEQKYERVRRCAHEAVKVTV